ncbi:MAG: PTS sugar transporter subunit IIC, partial [Lachnospiraceae bacterium]|nr:PTS sugar transporter subunit IIC [Lachnospiraceae bacterium]
MDKFKKVLNDIFVDGLTGMAYGLFATLIIGTIIKSVGDLVGGSAGYYISAFGIIAQRLTGAGIGVGVASRQKQPPFVVLSAATAGMIGAYASNIVKATVFAESGALMLAGPGEPLGAFIAAYVGITFGKLVAGKTKVDLIVTPAVVIFTGGIVGVLIGPPISSMMTALGQVINFSTQQQPVIMGILVSVIMGMILTLPISSAALGVILGLSGVAAGAATIGCCCQMVG